MNWLLFVDDDCAVCFFIFHFSREPVDHLIGAGGEVALDTPHAKLMAVQNAIACASSGSDARAHAGPAVKRWRYTKIHVSFMKRRRGNGFYLHFAFLKRRCSFSFFVRSRSSSLFWPKTHETQHEYAFQDGQKHIR